MVGWSGILTIASCKPYVSGYDFIPYLTFINQGFVAQLVTAQKINNKNGCTKHSSLVPQFLALAGC